MSLLYNPIQLQSKINGNEIYNINHTYSLNQTYIFQNIEQRHALTHFKHEKMRQRLSQISQSSVLSPIFIYGNGQCIPFDQQLYNSQQELNFQSENISKNQQDVEAPFSMMIYENPGLMEFYQYLSFSIFNINQNPEQLLISFKRLIKIFQNLLFLFQVLIQSNLLNNLSHNLNIQQFLINTNSLQICLFDFYPFKKSKLIESSLELSLNNIIGNLIYSVLTLTLLSSPNKKQKFNKKVFQSNVESTVRKLSFYQDLLKLDQSNKQTAKNSILTSTIEKLFLICLDAFDQNQSISIESLQGHIQNLELISQNLNNYPLV